MPPQPSENRACGLRRYNFPDVSRHFADGRGSHAAHRSAAVNAKESYEEASRHPVCSAVSHRLRGVSGLAQPGCR
ncbi:hypothetical protein BN2476_500136 [Paraburkholderia piptadeniae]|uniref:Uncharacterized protein n=1 Tax=Paraburkholderia piptadeniae TaxID=1701573 RepID=A0A1N7SFZ2_9BURK|nr:hypothetical protein BN2476_500136 [Paraburkholderia piptadeniae]